HRLGRWGVDRAEPFDAPEIVYAVHLASLTWVLPSWRGVANCCHLTRRQLLQWAALVAASPLLSALDDPERAYGLTRAAAQTPALPVNLELATLTETTAIVTCFRGDRTRPDSMGGLPPVPADTEVLVGTSSG